MRHLAVSNTGGSRPSHSKLSMAFFSKMISRWPNRRSFFKWVHKNWIHSSQWPNAISSLVYHKIHLTNPERFKVIVFFLGNGMSPEQVCDFFRITVNGFQQYDAQAWRQINWVIAHFPKNWSWWDCTLRHSVNRTRNVLR